MLFVIVLPLAVIIGGQLGLFAGTPPTDLGLHNGMLKAPEPGSMNVVSSYAAQQSGSTTNDIAPIRFDGDATAAFDKLKHIVAAMNGATIVTATPTYLYAQYRTRIMGFVDDVEFVLDAPHQAIQMRSASRIGKSDFGLNRRRLDTVRSRFNS